MGGKKENALGTRLGGEGQGREKKENRSATEREKKAVKTKQIKKVETWYSELSLIRTPSRLPFSVRLKEVSTLERVQFIQRNKWKSASWLYIHIFLYVNVHHCIHIYLIFCTLQKMERLLFKRMCAELVCCTCLEPSITRAPDNLNQFSFLLEVPVTENPLCIWSHFYISVQ